MKSGFIALEAKKWVNEKLIDASQAHKICNKYGVDFDNPKQKNKGYNTLVILACLFLGIALITLISENWDEIPHMLKTSVLIGITLGINTIAILKYRVQPNKATILFFLGGLFYGASIILIAQIYHLGEHMPDVIWWWAVGLIPFALLSKNNYLMLMPLALGFVWFDIEFSEFDNYKIGYLLFIALSAYSLYKCHKNTLLFISTSIIVFIFLLTTIYHFFFKDIWLIMPSLLLMFYTFSFFLEGLNNDKFKAYSRTLKTLVLSIASVSLLVLTHSEAWDIVFNPLFFYIATIIILVSALILLYYKQQIVAIGSIVVSVFNVLIQILIDENIYPLYMQATYSLIFIAFAIGLIITGINKSLSYYFFLGVINILLFAFVHYLNLFDDSYIGTSVLFITLAIVLLGSAKYWGRINDK